MQADILIGLRLFKNSGKWKEFSFKNRYFVMKESSSEEEEEDFDKEGLGTEPRPKSKVCVNVQII